MHVSIQSTKMLDYSFFLEKWFYWVLYNNIFTYSKFSTIINLDKKYNTDLFKFLKILFLHRNSLYSVLTEDYNFII